MKKIKKVSVTELDPKTGHIFDTTNIDNKNENTYSANTIDNLVTTVTNDNGKAIKFPDGTMICTNEVSATVDVTESIGSVFRSVDIALGGFAESFIEKPIVNTTITSGNGWMGLSSGVSKGNAGTVRIMRQTSNTNQSYIFHITAIGRWKE